MKKLAIVFWLCSAMTLTTIAQKSADTIVRKNTIKLDLTSYWLYRNAVVFSYERILKPNLSASLTLGYQEFPHSSSFGSRIAVRADNKKTGLKVGGEYRIYLVKENKYRAPHGVYIGPYVTYHRFSNERLIEVDNNGTLEEAVLSTNLNILNIGFQLGYQFVVNDRWTFDLVFAGPSVSNYYFNTKLKGGTFNSEDIQNEILLALIDEFPLLKEVIDEREAISRGKLDVWGYGYRYQFQIGYRFGKRK
jgi:hypothetical protein